MKKRGVKQICMIAGLIIKEPVSHQYNPDGFLVAYNHVNNQKFMGE